MPIYEYQCDKCNYHLEALQKINDKPLRECPDCGKHALRRLMSAPRFRLSGSGWYETDFKSDKDNKRNLVEKEKGEAPSTPAASTSDSSSGSDKPAAAPKEIPAKESSGGERGSSSSERGSSSSETGPSSSESASKRRVASKPAAVTKAAPKTKPRVAAKPAARKPAVRKR
jgi:putative FmdB family regulatory protein